MAPPRSGPPTPCLVVEEVAFAANLAAASALVAGTGKALRPHFKTHKTPLLAQRQMSRPGVVGLSCATVAEVEALADPDIPSILLANQIATAGATARLAHGARRAAIAVAVDHPVQVALLSAAAAQAGATLTALIDVDIGLGRCGVPDISGALTLAAAIEAAPGLGLGGLMGYEGQLRSGRSDRKHTIASGYGLLDRVADALRAGGHSVTTVSGGGTSTLYEDLLHPVLTEKQAGSYALMEADLDDLDLPFALAAHVRATVISARGAHTVVGAGRKAIGCEYGLPAPLSPRGRASAVSEEHTVVEWDSEAPGIGDEVALRPSQIRTTFNPHNRVWLHGSDGDLYATPITARGYRR